MKKIINKLNSFLLVLLCWLCFVIYWIIGRRKVKNKTIIIIQLAKLGDMVCTTPMFRAVRENYPENKIIVVGSIINKKLLENHFDIDDYLIWENSFSKLINDVRKIKPDFACITSPNFKVLAGLILAGVPKISTSKVEGGWCPFQTLPYRLILPLVTSIPHRFGNYAPREYLRLLEPIGIKTGNTTKHLTYSKKAGERVKKFFLEKRLNPDQDFIVCISPSAGNKIKNWGGKKFASLADFLFEKYKANILIIGSPRDEEEVSEMIANILPTTKVINIIGQLNLDELKAMISHSDLFISVDTGPIYIAEAFGVATIDIIGPMDEREQSPIGLRHKVIVPVRTAPQLHIMNARVYDKIEARRQVEVISVETVIETTDQLIKDILLTP